MPGKRNRTNSIRAPDVEAGSSSRMEEENIEGEEARCGIYRSSFIPENTSETREYMQLGIYGENGKLAPMKMTARVIVWTRNWLKSRTISTASGRSFDGANTCILSLKRSVTYDYLEAAQEDWNEHNSEQIQLSGHLMQRSEEEGVYAETTSKTVFSWADGNHFDYRCVHADLLMSIPIQHKVIEGRDVYMPKLRILSAHILGMVCDGEDPPLFDEGRGTTPNRAQCSIVGHVSLPIAGLAPRHGLQNILGNNWPNPPLQCNRVSYVYVADGGDEGAANLAREYQARFREEEVRVDNNRRARLVYHGDGAHDGFVDGVHIMCLVVLQVGPAADDRWMRLVFLPDAIPPTPQQNDDTDVDPTPSQTMPFSQ